MSVLNKIMKVSVALAALNLKKSGKNSFLKFEYYELSDFLPQLYQLCLENQLFLKVDIESDKAVLTVKDIEDGSVETFTHAFHYDIGTQSDKMDPMQREGCIATYMRRYVFMNAFGIVDPDGFDTTVYMKTYATKKKDVIEEVQEKFGGEVKVTQIPDYEKIATEASEYIDRAEEKKTKKECYKAYQFFSSKGITKENNEQHPLITAQYHRLNRVWRQIVEAQKQSFME